MPASRLLLIRPSAFGYNAETAESNVFQRKPEITDLQIQHIALTEFENMVKTLEAYGVELFIFDDHLQNTDSIFPNNWISFHEDGTVVLYPMMAESRRKERRLDIPEALRKKLLINRLIDLTVYEAEGKYLEGTGSIVFDHKNRCAYATLSPRTDESLFNLLCKELDYKAVVFGATDENGIPLYHTNVMMCVAGEFAIVCSESIKDLSQRQLVLQELTSTGKELIEISFSQMRCFAGNALFLRGKKSQPMLLLSETALKSLEPHQKQVIQKYSEIISPSIETIEKAGGGSVRCMVSEILLPYL